MPRFVEWDSFELRVNGERINEQVRAIVAGQRELERIELQFSNGLLRVAGTIRKIIAVPFTVDITEIRAAGTTVRVPLRAAAAFGAIPIPQFLFRLIKDRLPRELVSFEEPATFVVSLDRFLPPFIAVDIQKVWIIDGGLSVTLGRGGADLPPTPGG
jgi:hypothetical protein